MHHLSRKKQSPSCRTARPSRRYWRLIVTSIWPIPASLLTEGSWPIRQGSSARATDSTTMTTHLWNTSRGSSLRPSRSTHKREESVLSASAASSQVLTPPHAHIFTTPIHPAPSLNGRPNPAGATPSKSASSWRSTTRRT